MTLDGALLDQKCDGDPFAGPAPRIYTVPAGRPFLLDLAKGLARSTALAGDPLNLADVTLILPTRRAARELNEAVLAVNRPDGGAVFPPRVRSLGDVDEDELLIGGGLDADFDLPPAIPTQSRLMLLARLVSEWDRARGRPENALGALALARDLAGLLDSLYTEEIPAERLHDLAPDIFAAHWRESAEFLKIITEVWPAVLDERGETDPTLRRVKLMDAYTAYLNDTQPNTPVIVAGSTGAAPAAQRLMSVVAQLPMGAVVLPGLDLDLDDAAWSAIDDPHPQAGLKRLLEALNAERSHVRVWPGVGDPSARFERAGVLSAALRPADATHDWLPLLQNLMQDASTFQSALSELDLIEAKDTEEEARVIALALRETLETKNARAALVTPDRGLARRVSAQLRRWDVEADDSAGAPLDRTEVGTLLRQTARWAEDVSRPIPLLALLKHPLTTLGLSRAELLSRTRRLDQNILRGLRPKPGFEGLRGKIEAAKSPDATLLDLIDRLETAVTPFLNVSSVDGCRLEALIHAHIETAEKLSRSEAETSLWAGETGEAAAVALSKILAAAPDAPAIAPHAYAAIFDELLAGAVVRPVPKGTDRIAILGPLEARLISADHIILGGLNEGVWPRETRIDPWLNRPMRAELGLPSLERRIGLAAHDFAQLASAPKVTLARAMRADGSPQTASRWIVRLQNLLRAAECLDLVDKTAERTGWAQALDKPEAYRPSLPPSPRPPVAARPRALHATRVELLLRDPYAIYARYVLGLRPLDAIDQMADAAIRGTLIHDMASDIASADMQGKPIDAEKVLTHRINATGLDSATERLWRPRLERALEAFLIWREEELRRARPVLIEEQGQLGVDAPGGPFYLRARADRIDLDTDGKYRIIDFKTGAPPSRAQVLAGLSPQLPLEALIAEAGGFQNLAPADTADLIYVRLGGSAKDGPVSVIDQTAGPKPLVEATLKGLRELVAAFDDPITPYLSQPRPQFQNDWGDYDHLSRRKEWSAPGANGEGNGA